MASKKRKGTDPIRITLTEDQIADAIRNTSQGGRGFRVESLEDRIAPSRIGPPIGGGAEDVVVGGDTPPDVTAGGDPTTVGDPNAPPADGSPPPHYQPPAGPDYQPPAGPDHQGPAPAYQPPAGTPYGDPFDPAARHNTPMDPSGDPFDPAAGHTTPYDPMAGRLDPVQNPNAAFRFSGGGAVEGSPFAPPQGGPGGAPVHGPGGPELVDPNAELSEEEMRAHRQAILRQLRGG